MVGLQNAFVSGVGSGIGLNLAMQLLEQNYRVYGVGRRMPESIAEHPNFTFMSLDFEQLEEAQEVLSKFISSIDIDKFECVFLNVGTFGKRIAPMTKLSVAELDNMMRINVWSHKLLLDELINNDIAIEKAIFSASIAGVRARAGNGGYALTKAMLNMMAKLYMLENPSTQFLVLGLCSVNTYLSNTIATIKTEGDFPEINALRKKFYGSNYVVEPEDRARQIIDLIKSDTFSGIANGDFIEIRSLLK